MFTKIRQVNYAGLKKITTQGQNLRIISNIEATHRRYRLKMRIVSDYLETMRDQKEKPDSFAFWKRFFGYNCIFVSRCEC